MQFAYRCAPCQARARSPAPYKASCYRGHHRSHAGSCARRAARRAIPLRRCCAGPSARDGGSRPSRCSDRPSRAIAIARRARLPGQRPACAGAGGRASGGAAGGTPDLRPVSDEPGRRSWRRRPGGRDARAPRRHPPAAATLGARASRPPYSPWERGRLARRTHPGSAGVSPAVLTLGARPSRPPYSPWERGRLARRTHPGSAGVSPAVRTLGARASRPPYSPWERGRPARRTHPGSAAVPPAVLVAGGPATHRRHTPVHDRLRCYTARGRRGRSRTGPSS
jgi:hypothetical protein